MSNVSYELLDNFTSSSFKIIQQNQEKTLNILYKVIII